MQTKTHYQHATECANERQRRQDAARAAYLERLIHIRQMPPQMHREREDAAFMELAKSLQAAQEWYAANIYKL